MSGDPAEEDTDVGPVIDEDARDRILAWIEEARVGGAEILAGGELEGELIRPTVIASAAPDLKVSCERSSGRSSRSPMTRSTRPRARQRHEVRPPGGDLHGERADRLRAAQELEFGGVTVNEAPTFRADQMPYGGVKDSGNTREGPAYSVREFTEERVVVLAL